MRLEEGTRLDSTHGFIGSKVVGRGLASLPRVAELSSDLMDLLYSSTTLKLAHIPI